MARLGWIGLGRLGAQIAPRLIEAGHELVVHDRSAERTVAGARRATSSADVAAQCEALFLCVTDTDSVAQIAEEISRVDGAGKLVVDHSSIHPARTRELAARLREANGMAWVDAPVSGPVGSCAVFLGGDESDVARARPWIASYAGTMTHVGPLGSGQLAKSASQAIVCATIAAWAEVLAYARANGLDPAIFLDACEGAGSDSGVRRHFGPDILAGRLAPESIRNMIKEMEIVRDMARGVALSMPLNEVVRLWFSSGDRP